MSNSSPPNRVASVMMRITIPHQAVGWPRAPGSAAWSASPGAGGAPDTAGADGAAAGGVAAAGAGLT